LLTQTDFDAPEKQREREIERDGLISDDRDGDRALFISASGGEKDAREVKEQVL